MAALDQSGGSTPKQSFLQAAGEKATMTAVQTARREALTDHGTSVSVLVASKQVAGLIARRDEPRPDARAGLDRLRALGVPVVTVTGDNARTARAIAAALAIEPRADLLPEDKLRIMRELQARGEVVAKVGDGINDAPALAAADVGIPMGGGTDAAQETTDAAILHGRVADVARMVESSNGRF